MKYDRNTILASHELGHRYYLSDLIGPWADTDFESSLIERCKNAWSKPLQDLSSAELATLLQQRIAVTYLLPLARKRLKDRIEDGTEMYEGELEAAIEHASYPA